jgi:hypothetical protein
VCLAAMMPASCATDSTSPFFTWFALISWNAASPTCTTALALAVRDVAAFCIARARSQSCVQYPGMHTSGTWMVNERSKQRAANAAWLYRDTEQALERRNRAVFHTFIALLAAQRGSCSPQRHAIHRQWKRSWRNEQVSTSPRIVIVQDKITRNLKTWKAQLRSSVYMRGDRQVGEYIDKAAESEQMHAQGKAKQLACAKLRTLSLNVCSRIHDAIYVGTIGKNMSATHLWLYASTIQHTQTMQYWIS